MCRLPETSALSLGPKTCGLDDDQEPWTTERPRVSGRPVPQGRRRGKRHGGPSQHPRGQVRAGALAYLFLLPPTSAHPYRRR